MAGGAASASGGSCPRRPPPTRGGRRAGHWRHDDHQPTAARGTASCRRDRAGPTPPATSASSAAGSCPRRWSPRWTSSTAAYEAMRADPAFLAELDRLQRDYTGRPSAAHRGRRSSPSTPAAPRVLLKREDLNHTGSHKINNVLGQALLTKRMGKTRVIAETGAGQHGVATATAARAARPGLHRLHGRGGHPPAGAQRRPDAAARRRGHPGRPPARARSRTPSTRRSATG